MGIKHYKIKFLKNVTERDPPALPVTMESKVNKAIQERLRVNPTKLGSHYLADLRIFQITCWRLPYNLPNKSSRLCSTNYCNKA